MGLKVKANLPESQEMSMNQYCGGHLLFHFLIMVLHKAKSYMFSKKLYSKSVYKQTQIAFPEKNVLISWYYTLC